MLTRIRMSRRRASRASIVLGLTAAMAAAAGCAAGSDLGNGDCDMDTDFSALVGDLTVQYFASGTGDATISSLTYATELGPSTIDNPKLPYSATVQLSTVRARIRAKGASGTGTLAIGFGVSDLIGLLDQQQVTCP